MSPAGTDDSDALRALARALAPYLAEELRGYDLRGRPADGSLDPDYDSATAARYVEDLGRDVIDRAIELFSALAEPPHRIDSVALAERVGAVSPRDLPGILTTPLKRRADTLGLPWPWLDGEAHGRTIWRERSPGVSARIRDALEAASQQNRGDDLLVEEIVSHPDTQRPTPSAVFVWSSKSLAGLSPAARGSSVLRDSRPGSRAVIYRAEEPAAIVAMFDVAGYPEPSEKWRWVADGAFHILDEPIGRDELMASDELRAVFAQITSRRRLPPNAQAALRPLIEQRFADRRLPLFTGAAAS
jgi:hypothetical protein